MSKKISPSTIAPKALNAARQLREISAFLEEVDALETQDIPGWEYMQNRFFTEERGLLLDVADVLEGELAPEAETYA
ncbi:hypothetical protein ACFWGD_03950 [Corynebacterium sp. NPDC060344]|uniref:hypothetical protein n=1 Tax=Corynebacterium sp. NPDC060344 TaxID=3347101 RepID=UPI00364B7842